METFDLLRSFSKTAVQLSVSSLNFWLKRSFIFEELQKKCPPKLELFIFMKIIIESEKFDLRNRRNAYRLLEFLLVFFRSLEDHWRLWFSWNYCLRQYLRNLLNKCNGHHTLHGHRITWNCRSTLRITWKSCQSLQALELIYYLKLLPVAFE